MTQVSLFRLYALRAMYLLIAGGLAVTIWPSVISHGPSWPLMSSVVSAMLAMVSLLALLGLRYPLQMLPVLLFELGWKLIWLTTVALPLWLADALDAATTQTVIDCVPVIFVPLVLPWRYVWQHYLAQPGDRWTNRSAAAPSIAAAAAEA